ncbi:MAG: hypothetical protein MJ178_06070 [Treponemataceae bacterium]|nr:hypothetical protein [Treponemataceae bacterium]
MSNQIFTFECFRFLTAQELTSIIESGDTENLCIAMKHASKATRKAIKCAMGDLTPAMIKDDQDYLQDVTAARQYYARITCVKAAQKILGKKDNDFVMGNGLFKGQFMCVFTSDRSFYLAQADEMVNSLSSQQKKEALSHLLLELMPEKPHYRFVDLPAFDERSVQRFLREVDMADLAVCMVRADTSMYDAIIPNMSLSAANILKDSIARLGNHPAEAVKEARDKAADIINRLIVTGEIIPPSIF